MVETHTVVDLLENILIHTVRKCTTAPQIWTLILIIYSLL